MHMHKLTLNAHVALWTWLSTRHCISWKSYKYNYWAGAKWTCRQWWNPIFQGL